MAYNELSFVLCKTHSEELIGSFILSIIGHLLGANVPSWWFGILTPATFRNLGPRSEKFSPTVSTLDSWDELELLIHLSLHSAPGAHQRPDSARPCGGAHSPLLPLGHGVEQLEGDPGDETGHPQQDSLMARTSSPDYTHWGKNQCLPWATWEGKVSLERHSR